MPPTDPFDIDLEALRDAMTVPGRLRPSLADTVAWLSEQGYEPADPQPSAADANRPPVGHVRLSRRRPDGE